MNSAQHAQFAALVTAVNGLVAKVIELEKAHKTLHTTVVELPTVRDVEQMIAAHIMAAPVTRSAPAAPSSPIPSPLPAPSPVPTPAPQPVSPPVLSPVSPQVLSLDAASSSTAGAPLDAIEGLLSEGLSVAPPEKKKIVKKKK